MNRFVSPLFYGCLALGMLFFIATCSNDDGPQGPDFDRASLLRNYADNLIQPAFSELQQEVTTLQMAIGLFNDGVSAAEVANAREKWATTFLAWQRASPYTFGPAGEAGLDMSLAQEIGTFPVNQAQIEENIAATTLASSRDTRGLLTVEYLLYGVTATPAEIAASFTADPKRLIYLSQVMNDIVTRVTAVDTAWSTYAATFMANDGTSAGSSLSLLYNEFVRSFEQLKNGKVGLPAGRTAGQIQAEPTLVEAYYSGLSLSAIAEHLVTLHNIYYGIGADGVNGPGLADYLEAVTGGPDLVSLTREQWQQIQTALAALPMEERLSTLIEAGDVRVDQLHIELQKHTRFFKSDMSSLLGIAITFSSGDGD